MDYLPLLPIVLLVLGTERVNADQVLTVNGAAASKPTANAPKPTCKVPT